MLHSIQKSIFHRSFHCLDSSLQHSSHVISEASCPKERKPGRAEVRQFTRTSLHPFDSYFILQRFNSFILTSKGESMYNLFSARSVPSLERLESYVQVRHRPVIGTSDEAIPVGSTEDTRRLKKAGSSKQLDNVRSSQSRHTRESGELGRRLKNRRKPKQLSDLDVHTSRAPLIFQINLLEWIWLHSKSRLRILILAILFCFIIVNAVVAIWLFVAGEHVENPNICKTVACKNLRNRIVATLNRSVKPCDDFYAFVCGSSEVSHDLPEEENRFWHYGNDAARVDYNFSRSISLKRMLVNTDKFPYDIILSTYRACLQKGKKNS